jgi:hypothetical protein
MTPEEVATGPFSRGGLRSAEVAVRAQLNEHDVEHEDAQHQQAESHADTFPASVTLEQERPRRRTGQPTPSASRSPRPSLPRSDDRLDDADHGECRANRDSRPSQRLHDFWKLPPERSQWRCDDPGLGQCSGMTPEVAVTKGSPLRLRAGPLRRPRGMRASPARSSADVTSSSSRGDGGSKARFDVPVFGLRLASSMTWSLRRRWLICCERMKPALR